MPVQTKSCQITRRFSGDILVLLALACGFLLVGCAGDTGLVANATAVPSATPATSFSSPTPLLLPTDTPTSAPSATPATCLPPSPVHTPANTPIAASGWTTYTDSVLQVSLRYPANWLLPFGACPGKTVDMYNYDPRGGTGGSMFPSGGIKIELAPQPNPSQLSAQQFFLQVQQNEVGGPTCPSYQTQPLTVGGRDALQTPCPSEPSYGYEDYIPDGTTMLTIGTGGILDAQLTSLFQQIIASITFLT